MGGCAPIGVAPLWRGGRGGISSDLRRSLPRSRSSNEEKREADPDANESPVEGRAGGRMEAATLWISVGMEGPTPESAEEGGCGVRSTATMWLAEIIVFGSSGPAHKVSECNSGLYQNSWGEVRSIVWPSMVTGS
jgi:hypothetical protein